MSNTPDNHDRASPKDKSLTTNETITLSIASNMHNNQNNKNQNAND